MRLSRLVLAALAIGLPAAAHGRPAPAYAVVDKIKGPDDGWDYASFDPVKRRLYVARSTGAMAVDVDSGKVSSALSKTQRGHSALPIPGTSLVLSTDGGANTAILFDGETGAVAATIPVGTKPDAAAFDPATGTIWVMNADSGDASVIDLASKTVVATVAIGGALEFAVADGQGRLYVNVEDKNQLAVIDTRARKVLARHPLNGCDGPTGLAYMAEAKALVSACANSVAKVTGFDGADLGTLAIGPRPDAAIHDADRKLTFVPSGGDGMLAVIGAGADGKLAVLSRVPTAKGARTGALDPKTGRLYLPSASYGPPATPGGKPTPVPGSFAVLVVAPQGEGATSVQVLIVEDDASTAAFLCGGLAAQGHTVRRARDGREGLKLAQDGEADVLVVDRLLPHIDGLSVVRALRTAGIATPVLFLTALGGLSDKVEGLRAGGDDYLVKPFDLPELVARVEALGRRPPLSPDPNVIEVADIRLDRRAHAARRGGVAVDLTPREFRILELLALNAGRPVTRAMMVERALELDSDSHASLVEPHVSRLRTKLVRAGGYDRIHTVRGVGYVLVAD